MMNGGERWSWGMGWGMGGFGGIGIVLAILVVVGIAVLVFRRSNSRHAIQHTVIARAMAQVVGSSP